MKIPLLLLDAASPVPQHSHPGDGGVDLHARESATIDPGGRIAMPTGIAVAVPEGFAGLVTPRSGLAVRHGITVLNAPGLVDSGYRGEIKVILANLSDEPYRVERGDRIAQFVVVAVAVQEYEPVDVLPDSVRGEGGFGSTGR
jgi:dUTP pyrophosphatase